jgi:hypothetical protein
MMADPYYTKILRDIGLSEAIIPAHDLQQQQANTRVIDHNGDVIRAAIAPYLRGEKFTWGPSDIRKIPTEKAGNLSLITAYATTAPTTGDATVTITITTPSGTETVGTVRIPEDTQFSDPDTAEGLPYAVPAGAWLAYTVDAQGGSGFSVAAFVR